MSGDEAPPFSHASDCWPGLAKLAEECGEVVQVIGKFVQSGGTGYYSDGSPTADLPAMLADEIADVLAAVEFVLTHNYGEATTLDVLHRRSEKLRLFEKWASR